MQKATNPTKRFKFTALNFVFIDWLTPLIFRGFKSPLEIKDVYSFPHSFESDTLYQKMKHYWDVPLQERNSLFVMILWLFWKELLCGIILGSTVAINSLAIPQMIQYLIMYINTRSIDTNPFSFNGLQLTLLLFGIELLINISSHFSIQMLAIVSIKFESMLTMAIYQKYYRLSNDSQGNINQSKALNLINIDLMNCARALSQLGSNIGKMIQIIVVLAMLVLFLKIASIGGISVVFLILVFLFLIFVKLAQYFTSYFEVTDARLDLIREILMNMKSIKIHTLERFFTSKVYENRISLLKSMKGVYVLRILIIAVLQVTPDILPLAAFSLYQYLSLEFTADVIFPALALWDNLVSPLMDLPDGVNEIILAWISFNRIKEYLDLQEVVLDKHQQDVSSKMVTGAIRFDNATFFWRQQEENGKENEMPKIVALEKDANHLAHQSVESITEPHSNGFHLQDITLDIQPGNHVVICGPVGSGKSSILKALLGRINQKSGLVGVKGNIAYSGQVPLILSDTIRNNIVFTSTYDPQKLDQVVEASGLIHDLSNFTAGLDTEVGERGITLSGGQKARIDLARALYNDADIYLLDDSLSALDANVGQFVFDNAIKRLLKNKTVILVTHQTHVLAHFDKVVVMNKGRVEFQGTYLELQEAKHLSYLVHEKTLNDKHEQEIVVLTKPNEKKENGDLFELEERNDGFLSAEFIKEYIQKTGGLLFAVPFLVILIAFGACLLLSKYFLAAWVNGIENGLAWYASFIGAEFVIGAIAVGYFSFGAYQSARRYEKESYKSVMGATLHFFETQPIGRILNRLTKDVVIVDLSIVLTVYLTLIAILIGFCYLIFLLLIEYRMVFIIIPVLFLSIMITGFYRRFNMDLKRISSVSSSPLVAFMSESLEASDVVKSYGKVSEFIERQKTLIDNSLSKRFIHEMGGIWISLRLRVLFATLVLVISLLGLSSNTSASFYGIGLVYSAGLSNVVTLLVLAFNQLEATFNSIERLSYYINQLPQEPFKTLLGDEESKLDQTDSSITLTDVSLSYPSNPTAFVLKNINLEIKPGEKIGIIGRTGSGKSTILTALLRLVEIKQGSIMIGGVNIGDIDVKHLRQSIQVIPQEPFLYSGTLRSNLDIESKHQDKEIWDILEFVGLKEYVQSLPMKLESIVVSHGSNFSLGQRQLFCLSRAILEKPKILLMDEATASVDMKADQAIQLAIKKYFSETTILCIAHRIHTIMNFDKALVMDDGKLKEFDTIPNLIQMNGIFAQFFKASELQ